MPSRNYKDLVVWQKAMELIVETYRLVKFLPQSEIYALSDQMRRAVVSIPSNIAEGQGRDSTREFVHFLSIARGSCFELHTQFSACVLIGYLTEKETTKAVSLIDEIAKMLNALIKKLKTTY